MRINDRYADPVLSNLSTTSKAPTPTPPPRPDVDVDGLAHVAPLTIATHDPIGASLDATRDAFMGPYRVGNQTVPARPHFRMKGGMNESLVFAKAPDQRSAQGFWESLNAHGRELCRLCARAGVDAGPVMLGYGSPQALVKATQALIDAGKLETTQPTLADSIHQMQWSWGIGVDCVDYSMTAVSRMAGRSVGLQPGVDPFGIEGTATPPAFKKVDVLAAKPGDIITLKDARPDQPGHRVVVREHRVVVGADPDLALVTGHGPFHVYKVDSSWGADDGKAFGGYRRDTWVYDASSATWTSFSPRSSVVAVSTDGPAGELYRGTFRVKGES